MIEINEKGILQDNIVVGIGKAFNKFYSAYKSICGENNFYEKLVDNIFMLVKFSNLLDGSIEVIELDSSIDIEKLNIFINLIKKETYNTGLRIIKSENKHFIYLTFDNVYNKTYYVDDEDFYKEYKNILKFL